jgi:peptidoglycan/LPS O-acetylase OafA/YrhL
VPRTTTPAVSRRLPQLDALRGIAILLVLGRHADVSGLTTPFRYPVYLWQAVGWSGVDLFFVLSGFLVSGLLFAEYRREGRVRVGRFLARRALKIYPAFYAFLALTLFIGTSPITGAPGASFPITPARAASEALFLQSYAPRLWVHTWSLSVEEHFYLLVAMLIAGLAARGVRRGARDPFRVVVPLAALVMAYSVAARGWTVIHEPSVYSFRYSWTHLRLDGLTFGVCLAYFYHFHRVRLTTFVARWRFPLVCASAMLVAPILGARDDTRVMQSAGLALAALGFGGILIVSAVAPERPWRAVGRLLPAIAWLGTYSYSVYLWHFPVRAWAMPAITALTGWVPSPWADLVVYLALCVAVGVVMARLVEMPVLALRDRWLPSRGAAGPKLPSAIPEMECVTP